MSVTSSQIDVVARLLDATAIRHRVISQNVANVNTPGYKSKEVTFEAELARLLDEGRSQDVRSVEPTVRESIGLAERADGNNVDIDRQMGSLHRNALLHQTYTRILGSRLSMIRSAVTGQQ